jgi:hypothetical protein
METPRKPRDGKSLKKLTPLDSKTLEEKKTNEDKYMDILRASKVRKII